MQLIYIALALHSDLSGHFIHCTRPIDSADKQKRVRTEVAMAGGLRWPAKEAFATMGLGRGLTEQMTWNRPGGGGGGGGPPYRFLSHTRCEDVRVVRQVLVSSYEGEDLLVLALASPKVLCKGGLLTGSWSDEPCVFSGRLKLVAECAA